MFLQTILHHFLYEMFLLFLDISFYNFQLFVVLNLFISVILVAFNEEQKYYQVGPFGLVFKSH